MSVQRQTTFSARYGVGVTRSGADWLAPPPPQTAWQREQERGEIQPMDTIGGWYVPAWAIALLIGVPLGTLFLFITGAW